MTDLGGQKFEVYQCVVPVRLTVEQAAVYERYRKAECLPNATIEDAIGKAIEDYCTMNAWNFVEAWDATHDANGRPY